MNKGDKVWLEAEVAYVHRNGIAFQLEHEACDFNGAWFSEDDLIPSDDKIILDIREWEALWTIAHDAIAFPCRVASFAEKAAKLRGHMRLDDKDVVGNYASYIALADAYEVLAEKERDVH